MFRGHAAEQARVCLVPTDFAAEYLADVLLKHRIFCAHRFELTEVRNTYLHVLERNCIAGMPVRRDAVAPDYLTREVIPDDLLATALRGDGSLQASKADRVDCEEIGPGTKQRVALAESALPPYQFIEAPDSVVVESGRQAAIRQIAVGAMRFR